MTKDEKIKIVAGLLLEGKAKADVIKYVQEETDWGIGDKAIEGYITDANKLNKETPKGAKDAKVNGATDGKDDPTGKEEKEDGPKPEIQPGSEAGDQGDPGDEDKPDTTGLNSKNAETYKSIKKHLDKEPEGQGQDNQGKGTENPGDYILEDGATIVITKDDLKKFPALKDAGVKKKAIIAVKYSDFPKEKGETYGAYVHRLFDSFDSVIVEVKNPEEKEPEDKTKDNGDLKSITPKAKVFKKEGKAKEPVRSLSNLKRKQPETPEPRKKAEAGSLDYIDQVVSQVEVLQETIDDAIRYRQINTPKKSNRRLLMLKANLKEAAKGLKE